MHNMPHRNYQTFSGFAFTDGSVLPITQEKDFHIVYMVATAVQDPSTPTLPFMIQFFEGSFSSADRRLKLCGNEVVNAISRIEFNSPMLPLKIEKGFPASICAYVSGPPNGYAIVANFQYTIVGYWE